jgi:hypothetical protein
MNAWYQWSGYYILLGFGGTMPISILLFWLEPVIHIHSDLFHFYYSVIVFIVWFMFCAGISCIWPVVSLALIYLWFLHPSYMPAIFTWLCGQLVMFMIICIHWYIIRPVKISVYNYPVDYLDAFYE